MTSIYFEIDGIDQSANVLRADIWREAATGIGRWEAILDPRTIYWPGTWASDVPIEIQINGSLMMLGYVDDVKPFLEYKDISRYDIGTSRHTGLWKFIGRDYGMDLAQFYFTAAAGDYQYTLADDLIANVLTSLVATYGAGNPEITYASPSAAPVVNYDWAPRTYLTDGFREVAELVDYDFYVQDIAARTLHFFDIATMGAGAEHTAVNLISLAGSANNNILDMEFGEELGAKQKNYIEVHAGFLDDHWTEVVDDPAAAPNPSPDWTAGPISTVTEEYNIFINGKGAIRCTQGVGADWMYMRLIPPVGNDPKTGWDLRDESHIRYLTYQEDTWDGGVGVDNVSVALVDDTVPVPRIIVYILQAGGVFPQDFKYTGPLADLEWYEMRVPIGEDTIIGGWFPAWQQWTANWLGAAYVYPAGIFNWSNVQEIVFTSAQNTLQNGFFIIDGLQIPTVEAVALSQAVVTPSPGYRMKHFYRPDIHDHFVLDALSDKLRDQYRYVLETLKVTAIGQTLSKYAGQSLDVLAPVFGIGTAPATYDRYRIFKLHHSVVRNSEDSTIPGFTFLTDYELIKQEATATPQLVHPMRVQFDSTPTEAMLREFRLEQKYRTREKYRRHL